LELYDTYYKNDKETVDENEEIEADSPSNPYNGQELGEDPAICPVEGFEWRGRDAPGGRRGNWYNEENNETLHPDLNHEPLINPHWDYIGPGYPGARLYIDGTWENKK